MNYLHTSIRAAQVITGSRLTDEHGTSCGLPSIHDRTYRQHGYCISESRAWDFVRSICGAADDLEAGIVPSLNPNDPSHYAGMRRVQSALRYLLQTGVPCPDCRIDYDEFSASIILDRILEQGCPPEVDAEFGPRSTKKGARMVDRMWIWMKETGPKRKSDMSEFAFSMSHPTWPLTAEIVRYAGFNQELNRTTWNNYPLETKERQDARRAQDPLDHSSFFRSYWTGEFMLSMVRQGTNFWGTNFAVYSRRGTFRKNRDGLWVAGDRPW